MNSIRQELTDEQVQHVLSLAGKIEQVATELNLSMRNHASPYTDEDDEYQDGYEAIDDLETRPLSVSATATSPG